jgi:hypothetical protein
MINPLFVATEGFIIRTPFRVATSGFLNGITEVLWRDLNKFVLYLTRLYNIALER